MSVTLTGTGGLFVRLGKIFQAIESANVYQGDVAITSASPDLDAIGTSYTEILAQYASAQQFVLDDLAGQRDGARSSLDSWKSYLAGLAQTTLIEQVHADATLSDKTLFGAMYELIRQMSGSGGYYSPDNDVDASTVSGSWGSFLGIYGSAATGTGAAVVSVLRPDGKPNEHVFAEVADFVCTTDGQADGTARRETFTFAGEAAQSDPLAFDWPDGSGSAGSVTVVDADEDAGANLLTNSNFDDQDDTANVPDNWLLLVGTAGTTILEETTTVLRAGSSVEFVGDAGGTLTSIAQTFNSATGTSATLRPNTVYQGVVWLRKSAGAVAGAIQVGLVDGSNNAVNDDAGTANTLTVANGSITTSFTAHSFTFVTPKDVPSTVKIRVRVSTGITSGESIFADDLTMCEATEMYTGGPWVSIHAGATDFIAGDRAALTISANGAGEFQQYFDRVFDMRSLGLQLPSDTGGTETIVDTLIG